MKRRIILHIGSPKCGSTYLQQVMVRNRARLGLMGIAYPEGDGTHPGNAAALAEIDRATLEGYFADGAHTLVLSHEDLYSLAKRGDALAALVAEDGTQVQVVAFLRPFCEFFFGDYSQFMKQHFQQFLASRSPYGGRNFREFAARRRETLQPALFLSNWQKRFPRTPVLVENHRAIRPVMERLLDAEDMLDWEVEAELTNPSLRMEDCDRLVAAMRDPDIPDEVIEAMFLEAFHHTDAPDAGRSDARKVWIEEMFAPQNAALLAQFGYDNRLPGYPPVTVA